MLILFILTDVRMKEAIHAKVEEFDLNAAVWTVPADRMKMRKPHRIPLSPPALAIAKRMIEERRAVN